MFDSDFGSDISDPRPLFYVGVSFAWPPLLIGEISLSFFKNFESICI